MELRNSNNSASVKQRNERRRENSRWGITLEDNNEACNPSFGTCSTNDMQSATNPFLKRSGREFAYCDTSKSYENRSEWRRTQRSWGYEKRYQSRSHTVCDYERQVDSRGSDPSMGISSSNSTMPRKNPPQMWDYNGRHERRWNQRKWGYECQVNNRVGDSYADRYSANEVLPVTNPRQTWDYDKRYQWRWNERVWNYKREVLPVKNLHGMWDHNVRYERKRNQRTWDYERQVDNRGSNPSLHRSSSNSILPMTNPPGIDQETRYERRKKQRMCDFDSQVDNRGSNPSLRRSSSNSIMPMTNPPGMSEQETRYERRKKQRMCDFDRQVADRGSNPSLRRSSLNYIMPMTNPPGMSDQETRYERRKKQRMCDFDSQVADTGSDPSLRRSSSNSIKLMTNPPGMSDQETRYERRKKQRMCDFERQVADRDSDPSVGIAATDGILLETNPSVNASVKTCTNFEPIVSQHVEVMEDNLIGRAPISCVVGEAPSLSEVVKDETGVMVKEKSSEEAHLIVPRRKKLIILDVNGLLADFVPYVPNGYKPDITISRKAVFKRPFCDDFLQFCFKQFEVGVWSSRVRKNLKLVIDFLMGDLRHKLLFCWDQSHCTETGLTTVENRSKPLVLKELRKIWENLDPNLPWRKGEFNESNTVLLDDSPYKALRNPVNTSIFPYSYSYKDIKDTSLGPGGDLRVYIEGLAMAENIQKYIKQNPFGQSPITELNPSWGYYRQIVHSGCVKEEGTKDTSAALPALKSK